MINTLLLDASRQDDIDSAVALLTQGELVAVPTETVYGLAADASDPTAVEKIYKAKARPRGHPLIVHVGSMEVLEQWAVDIPDLAMDLAAEFWPGPLTLVLKKAPTVNTVVTGGLDTIAVRMPAHPVLLQILKQSGLALAAPSANPYGQLSPTTARQVLETMAGKINAVLDGGACEIGLESTIVDPQGRPIRILRSGPVSAAAIRDVVDVDVITPVQHDEVVPGNVKAHYQPRASLRIVDKNKLLASVTNMPAATACLVYSPEFRQFKHTHIKVLPAEKAAYSQQLYRSIYELDKPGINEIWVEAPPTDEEWLDVNDRLARATAAE